MGHTTSASNQPLLTLSIVSHGDALKIERLLQSLRQYEQTDRIQLLLTDNLGRNLPAFDPTGWAGLQVLRNDRPRGFARNQNRAFQQASGEYFCILNPDVIFNEPLFDALLAQLSTGRADIIAPLVVDSNGNLQDSFRSLPTPLEILRRRLPGFRFEPPAPDPDGTLRPDWIAGIFLLMPSAIYRQLGGLDERYRLYFEDVDFCTRARLAGLKLLVEPGLRVQHDASRSSHRNFYYFLLHTRSALRFFSSAVYRQAQRAYNPGER